MKHFLLYNLLLFILFGCTDKCENENIISENIEVKAFRFDQKIRNARSENDVKTIFNEAPAFEEFFLKHHFPSQGILYKEMYKLGSNQDIEVLFNEVDKKYADFSDVEKELSTLFRRVKYYYPEFKAPQIVTFVSGFGGYDLVVSEGLIIIGLDYFLGEKAKFKPNDFPAYILKHYEKENITSKIAYFIAQRYAEENLKDDSMLAQMIFHGKVYEFTKTMMPCAPDSLIVEYSKEDLELSSQLDGFTWSFFQKNKLFFTTDNTIITKYIDNRPHTLEIGEKCPGRIGRWMGYEIVKSYVDNNDVSIQELMKTNDANLIFNKSKYKPQNQL